MSTPPIALDPLTLTVLLDRTLDNHARLEHLVREKQAAINQLNTQLNQALVELERLRGALEGNGISVRGLKDDLEKANAMVAAAKAAADLAARTAAVSVPPTIAQ